MLIYHFFQHSILNKYCKMINQAGNRQEINPKQKFVYLCLGYIIFAFLLNAFHHSSGNDQKLLETIKNDSLTISFDSFIRQLSQKDLKGSWQQLGIHFFGIDFGTNGSFHLTLQKHLENGRHYFLLNIILYKNLYIQDGTIQLNFPKSYLNSWKITHQQSQLIAFLDQQQPIEVQYQELSVFSKVSSGQYHIKSFQIIYKLDKSVPHGNINKQIKVTDKQDQILAISIEGQNSDILQSAFLGLILFFISYRQFNAIITIQDQFQLGTQNPANYSYKSLLMANMWDSIFCFVSFTETFKNDSNLILYIFQTFLFFVMTVNLQIYVLMIMYKKSSAIFNSQKLLCRLSITLYSCMALLYFIAVYGNLHWSLYLFFSLIFLPQIYTNARQSHRPSLSHSYYRSFLLQRFLFLFYLKLFPWNIYKMAPDYILCLTISIFVLLQYGMLWIQKQYGPKKVVPSFLLPPVHKYELQLSEEQTNSSEKVQKILQTQCAICLNSLSKEPENDDREKHYKLMKTPCNHLFHGKCLTQWMNIKMECPNCRNILPVLQYNESQ